MTHTTAPAPAPARKKTRATTERAFAATASLAPLATAATTPVLNDTVTLLATAGYAATAAALGANYMNRLPSDALQHLPADILHAQREPLFISTLTTGIALGATWMGGAQGADALLAGITTLPTVPGIVSLGWWAAVALVPFKLRKVLFNRQHPMPGTRRATNRTARQPLTPADRICKDWARHISGGPNPPHKDQELTLRSHGTHRWTGTITAPAGTAVNVTAQAVSSVYRVRPEWVTFREGSHAGEVHIVVNLIAPPELNTDTLQGAWKKWVARSGGVMAGSHLVDVQDDPNTGGEVAYVVAGDGIDKLPVPDRATLAGALRTNTLLCSYTPTPGNPRRGEIRVMDRNPLEDGVPFPGTDVLKISKGGYVQVGRHTSGFPARIQFVDPKLGAKHLFVAGVTGSGKGGLVQIVALADHVNGHAIIYGDPKGSSNPDVETMACFSAAGETVLMGSMRVIYALMRHRIELTARLKMKNFKANPEMPWVRFILDEAHVPLTEMHDTKQEASIILDALAAKARSLGIILCVVNQAVNADKLGGSTALRMNVIQGGSLVMLRSDSGQQHLVTTGFEGIDPGQIPPAWDVERPLVYDDKVDLADPASTFGLGYTLGPGGTAEMMRTFILESAAPYIDPAKVVYPMDWPDWEHRDEIANQPIDAKDAQAVVDGDEARPTVFTGIDLTSKKEPTAEEKVLTFLNEIADPDGEEPIYAHKDDIARLANVKETTLNNTLNNLKKTNRIHVQPGERGHYAIGPKPADTNQEQESHRD